MRKITATYIFTLTGAPIKNGIVVVDDDGTILDIVDRRGDTSEIAGLEYYSGIVVPGFVNAHCHLGQSHLKGLLKPNLGFTNFMSETNLVRKSYAESVRLKAAKAVDAIMSASGVVAVGDVENSSYAIEMKSASKMYYHSFIECFGFMPSDVPIAVGVATSIFDDYRSASLDASIVPHSVHSVSDELFDIILDHSNFNDSIFLIHHHSCESENEMFTSGTGQMVEFYQSKFGFDASNWNLSKIGVTQKTIEAVPYSKRLILSHNTYASRDDIQFVAENRSSNNTFFVITPSSDLFINGQLPDIQALADTGFDICIGTEGASSNAEMSMINEMRLIQEKFGFSTEELLRWACINGAKALNINEWAGTIDIDKAPGLVLITGVNFDDFTLSRDVKSKRL